MGDALCLDRVEGARLRREASLAYFLYIDNIGVIATSQEEADGMIHKVARALELVGLPCHEVQCASQVQESLCLEFRL